MTNYLYSGERDESSDASRLIEGLISEVLEQTEFSLQSITIPVPDHLVHELDIEVIQVGEGVVHLARPDTEEHTRRSLYIIRREDTRLMNVIEVEVPRDRDREVSAEAVERVLGRYDELLDEGEALGVINKQQLFEEAESVSNQSSLAIDRHALAVKLGEDEIADQIMTEIKAKYKHEKLSEADLTGEPTVDLWLEELVNNIAHRNDLANQAMDIEAEYSKAAMAAIVEANPQPLDRALAWQVQRDVDRALNPES